MSLQLTGVTAGYGATTVLRQVDLLVPSGTAVALLGANGAGKTTLLRTAAGLVSPQRGRVILGDTDITRRPPYFRERAGLCLIPEGRGIFAALSVKENLAMFVGGRRVNEAIAIATATFPVLGNRLQQRAGTLSGGEQQMLALCRALVTKPAVVLADELSVGLAPVIVDQIFDAVEILRRQGTSLLLVEQYVERVLDVVDWVFLLHRGRIVWSGDPARARETRIYDRYLQGAA